MFRNFCLDTLQQNWRWDLHKMLLIEHPYYEQVIPFFSWKCYEHLISNSIFPAVLSYMHIYGSYQKIKAHEKKCYNIISYMW